MKSDVNVRDGSNYSIEVNICLMKKINYLERFGKINFFSFFQSQRNHRHYRFFAVMVKINEFDVDKFSLGEMQRHKFS